MGCKSTIILHPTNDTSAFFRCLADWYAGLWLREFIAGNKSVFIGEMLSGLQPSLKVGKKNMVSNSASGLLEWVERGSTTIF